jgi:tetratricopeptide (TPR) repeat protein
MYSSVIGLMLLLLSVSSYAQHHDERLTPITRGELELALTQTPLESPKHEILIRRASTSRLTGLIYERYTRLWKRKQNDPHLNLWRGIAAMRCFKDVLIKKLPREGAPPINVTFRAAQSCLENAVKLAPGSALAQGEYGYYLFQWGNDQQKGVELMKKSVELNPKNATIRTLLGDALSNITGKFYRPTEAEKELKTALELDPDYAEPHFLLMFLYRQEGNKDKAELEKQAYKNLTPPDK